MVQPSQVFLSRLIDLSAKAKRKAPRPLGKAGRKLLDGSGLVRDLSPIVECMKHDEDTQAQMDPDSDVFI